MTEEADYDPVKDIEDLLKDLRKCMMCKRSPSEITSDNCCDFCRPKPWYPQMAPEDTIYVCGACGKVSKDLYGNPETSWDESCMLNAVMCEEDSKEKTGNWVAAEWEDENGIKNRN